MEVQTVRESVKKIIEAKPLRLVVVFIVYLLIVALLKWQVHPPIFALTYFLGGVLGIYLMDAAEIFFHLEPSPFRSIVFVGGLIMVSVFVITSSGSAFASGLTLTLYFSIMLSLWQEWLTTKALASWFRLFSGPIGPVMQERMLYGASIIFIILTLLFIRTT